MPALPMTFGELLRALDSKVLVRGRAPNAPLRGVSTDTRTLREGDVFIALRGERHCGNEFVAEAFRKGAAVAIVRRDAPYEAPEGAAIIGVDEPTHALGHIAREHRRGLTASVVAVTGSVGKTTTRELIRHLLGETRGVVAAERSFNNAIGVPLTLLKADADTRVLVVEVGTNAPGEIRALTKIAFPDVAVVTRVAPAHLEGLGTIDGVAHEKGDLVRGLRPRSGIACLNADDPRVRAMEHLGQAATVFYGMAEDAEIRGEVMPEGECSRLRFRVRDRAWHEVRLPFPSPLAPNALAALAAVHALGLRAEALAPRLEHATLPARRLEVRRHGGLTIIDDAYNANPASVEAALHALAQANGRRVLVFGEMRELGAAGPELHREVGVAAVKAGVELLVGVGPLAAHACTAAAESGLGRDRVCAAAHRDEALAWLTPRLRAGDYVLVKGSRAARLETLIAALPFPKDEVTAHPTHPGRGPGWVPRSRHGAPGG